jgi:drug/metabolite transporter (DMT)-like permease
MPVAAEALDVLLGATDTHAHLRRRLLAIGIFSFLLSLVCAGIAYLLEHGARDTEIRSLWDAFFWTSTQLLTVSSSIKNPVTVGGQVLDIFMEAYAITVVATLAGSFGAFFHMRSVERKAAAQGD